jgi:redox-sensitive bicupin YhaK (pirin superfamily)
MIKIRKANERGNSQSTWLNSSHTFSFAEYHDPNHLGFGKLRVINEDIVQPGMGFGLHPHHDMEIISYVVAGSLEHKDSLGNGSVIKPGEIQLMTAGNGIKHSEFNHSKDELLHFLQIWIVPNKKGLKPNYQQKTIQKKDNELILIGSNQISESTVLIHQDINLYTAYMTPNHSLQQSLQGSRMSWLQLIKGSVQLNGTILLAGDGAAVQPGTLTIECHHQAEFLLFDLPSQRNN